MTTYETWNHRAETELGEMTIVPLTPARFADMEEVFGERGVARRCFCMHWRRPNGGYPFEADNRDRFSAIVDSSERPPGLLGYVVDKPVGWVQVGPREDFPTIGRSRLFAPVDDLPVWSINCFVVRPGHRKQGVARGLLAGAIRFAVDSGATAIEAYPVDGTRQSVVDYFTGILPMFSEHGFVEIARRNPNRPVVRLET